MFGGTDCAYEQGASRVCLLQSREQGFWKSQDQSSSCSYGHTNRMKSPCSTS
jgi:hypothetical protein